MTIMLTPKFTRWSSTLILVCGLEGCLGVKGSEDHLSVGSNTNIPKGLEQTATMEKQMQKATHRRLVISKENNAGRLVRIGALEFDKSNHATLSTDSTDPAAEELKSAWDEISKLKELTWKHSSPGEIGGEKVTRIIGETARPGDAMYIYAVLNTLERKYGYSVDLAD